MRHASHFRTQIFNINSTVHRPMACVCTCPLSLIVVDHRKITCPHSYVIVIQYGFRAVEPLRNADVVHMSATSSWRLFCSQLLSSSTMCLLRVSVCCFYMCAAICRMAMTRAVNLFGAEDNYFHTVTSLLYNMVSLQLNLCAT